MVIQDLNIQDFEGLETEDIEVAIILAKEKKQLEIPVKTLTQTNKNFFLDISEHLQCLDVFDGSKNSLPVESELILIKKRWYMDYKTQYDKIINDKYDYIKIVSNWSGNCIGIKLNGKLTSFGNLQVLPYMDLEYNRFIDVVCGVSHCVGLRTNGTICTWGDNFLCMKNEPTYIPSNEFRKEFDIPSSDIYNCVVGNPRNKFKKISCGDFHSVGIRLDGTLAIWGDPSYGSYLNAPKPDLSITWLDVACSKFETIGLKTDGTIYVWGQSCNTALNLSKGQSCNTALNLSKGQSCNTALNLSDRKNMQSNPNICGNKRFVSIAAGSYTMGGITESGSIISWFTASAGKILYESYIPEPQSTPSNPFVKIICGKTSFIAIKSDQTADIWGWSGDDKTNFINFPNDKKFIDVISSSYGFIGIKPDRTIDFLCKASQTYMSQTNKKFISVVPLNDLFIGITPI